MTAIPMILHCPECGERHVDAGGWAERPHHTHACQHCGCVWRPAVVDTVGVQFLPGFRDGPFPTAEQVRESIQQGMTHLCGELLPDFVRKAREAFPNAYRPWGEAEDRALRGRAMAGAPFPDLCAEFGRTSGGISSRLEHLKLSHLYDGGTCPPRCRRGHLLRPGHGECRHAACQGDRALERKKFQCGDCGRAELCQLCAASGMAIVDGRMAYVPRPRIPMCVDQPHSGLPCKSPAACRGANSCFRRWPALTPLK